MIPPILSNIFGGLIKNMNPILDRLPINDKEKMKMRNEMQALVLEHKNQVEDTVRTQMGATRDITVAELQQDDKFTKRARPMVIYVGLFLILWTYWFAPTAEPFIGIQAGEVPSFFWNAWAAIVGAYALGRSYEKGQKNKAGINDGGSVG